MDKNKNGTFKNKVIVRGKTGLVGNCFSFMNSLQVILYIKITWRRYFPVLVQCLKFGFQSRPGMLCLALDSVESSQSPFCSCSRWETSELSSTSLYHPFFSGHWLQISTVPFKVFLCPLSQFLPFLLTAGYMMRFFLLSLN